MPADEIEVVEGEEEGVVLHSGRGPRAVVAENGRLAALRTVACTSVFDANGRFNPAFNEAQVEDIAADTLIFAIGQSSDLSFLRPEDGIESERGLIKVDRETYQTTAPDVFACGDIAHGARLFIDAIASAQTAARSMHDYLRGTRTDVVVRRKWAPAAYTMVEGWHRAARANPPVLESAQRAASLEIIEERYPEADARRQGARCLRCNVDTVFDTMHCIACNGCIDICPENLIRLIGLGRIASDPDLMKQAAATLGLSVNDFAGLSVEDLDALGGVMLKDETTCIRCALCASRCPTHAITMLRFDHYRECVTVPAQNDRIRYS
jgi:ferredoxin